MQQSSYPQAALRAILSYQLIAKKLTDERKQLMDSLDLAPGEKINVATDWGESLGSISHTKPRFTATVDDPAIALAEHSDEIEFTLRGGDTSRLIEFLLDTPGGDQFLTPTMPEHVEKQLASEALKQWRKTGQAPAGWRIAESRTSVRATATQLAKDLAEDAMDELAPRLALEMGDDDDA